MRAIDRAVREPGKDSFTTPALGFGMIQQPTLPEGERRRAPRQKSLLRGTISYNGRRNAVDCVIRDISPYGARLIFSDAFSTPDVMELHIPQKDQTLRVNVIWRSGHECGVAFAQAATAGAGAEPTELTDRVQRLEAEVAGLKRILRKLRHDVDGDVDAA